MTAPSTPYATPDDVALLQSNLLRGAKTFDKSTVLTESTITEYINWINSAVDLKFSEAGFILPLAEIDNETWPIHQTTYLKFVVCIGVVSLMNPSVTPNKSGTGTTKGSFGRLYDDELVRIYDGRKHHLRFRAKSLLDSPAHISILEPVGPTSDFVKGKINPEKYMNLKEYTDFRERVKKTLVDVDAFYLDKMFGINDDKQIQYFT